MFHNLTCGGFCLIMLVLSLAPMAIAAYRDHRNLMAISVCSLCGVIFLPCWLVALIWSFSDNVVPRH